MKALKGKDYIIELDLPQASGKSRHRNAKDSKVNQTTSVFVVASASLEWRDTGSAEVTGKNKVITNNMSKTNILMHSVIVTIVK